MRAAAVRIPGAPRVHIRPSAEDLARAIRRVEPLVAASTTAAVAAHA